MRVPDITFRAFLLHVMGCRTFGNVFHRTSTNRHSQLANSMYCHGRDELTTLSWAPLDWRGLKAIIAGS